VGDDCDAQCRAVGPQRGGAVRDAFHAAWDTPISAFGTRQVLYERFFASDPLTRARVLNVMFLKQEVKQRVLDFLHRDVIED